MPRPYECVRRAWHSDRHQPLRGSLIQQIFRLVHESHSSVTKKNKEWQEKLPIVVLKAEEIMYSKANSESEYMDLETLWQRVNDAVDTIIRRDESTETGDLLPPCVEAALHLGCVPVRASRSQRYNNHRSYLGPRALESANPTSSPPTTWDKTTAERCPQLLPFHLSNRPKFARENVGNRAVLVSEPNSHQFKTDNVVAPDNHSCLHKKNLLGHDQMTAKETSTALSIGSVYPLYYGALYHDNESQFGPQILERTNSDGIFVGNPISMSVPESTRMGVVRNLFTFGSARQPEIASKGTTQRNIHNKNDLPEKECDLSLRLGLFLDPSTNVESAGVGSASYRKGWKYSGLSSDMEKEFCFSSGNTANVPINSCLAKRLREDEAYKEPTVRKQKTPFSSIFEDGQFSWQPELLPYQFTGHMKGPGF